MNNPIDMAMDKAILRNVVHMIFKNSRFISLMIFSLENCYDHKNIHAYLCTVSASAIGLSL